MSNFNQLYQLFTESNVPSIFRAATEDELKTRRAHWNKIALGEWIAKFKGRSDIRYVKELDAYDVEGSVYLDDMGLTCLPVRFNTIGGSFNCSGNLLSTTDGFPRWIGGNTYNCSDNRLTSLVGGPVEIRGKDAYFICSRNPLVNLDGFPVGDIQSAWCWGLGIASPKGCPDRIGCSIDLSHNRLTTLVGSPSVVGWDFTCSYNKTLSSAEGCPRSVGNDFLCQGCAMDEDGFTYEPKLSVEEIRKGCKVGGVIQNF